MAQVHQLLDVLSGIIGMQPADMAAILRKWPRYLACEPTQPRSAGRFLREELGLTTGTAALLLRKSPWLLAMEVHILQQRQSICHARWRTSLHRAPTSCGRAEGS